VVCMATRVEDVECFGSRSRQDLDGRSYTIEHVGPQGEITVQTYSENDCTDIQ
jgi:hypothetical protein